MFTASILFFCFLLSPNIPINGCLPHVLFSDPVRPVRKSWLHFLFLAPPHRQAGKGVRFTLEADSCLKPNTRGKQSGAERLCVPSVQPNSSQPDCYSLSQEERRALCKVKESTVNQDRGLRFQICYWPVFSETNFYRKSQ